MGKKTRRDIYIGKYISVVKLNIMIKSELINEASWSIQD